MRGILTALGSTLWFLAAGMSDAGAAMPNLGIIAISGMACLVAGQIVRKGERKNGKKHF